jgi:hypothetical protein
MENQTTTIDILEKMKEIAEGCMGEAAAYCVAACPMHTDAKGYVGLINEGKYEEAFCPPRWEGSAPIPARTSANAERRRILSRLPP